MPAGRAPQGPPVLRCSPGARYSAWRGSAPAPASLCGWVRRGPAGALLGAAAPVSLADACAAISGDNAEQRDAARRLLRLLARQQARVEGVVVATDYKPAGAASLLHARDVRTEDVTDAAGQRKSSVDLAVRLHDAADCDARVATEWFVTSSDKLSLRGDTVRRKMRQVRAVLTADDCPGPLRGAMYMDLCCASERGAGTWMPGVGTVWGSRVSPETRSWPSAVGLSR